MHSVGASRPTTGATTSDSAPSSATSMATARPSSAAAALSCLRHTVERAALLGTHRRPRLHDRALESGEPREALDNHLCTPRHAGCTRLDLLREQWETAGRPFLTVGARGAEVEHPLHKVMRPQEILVDRLVARA